MGTDIHPMAQRRENGTWRWVEWPGAREGWDSRSRSQLHTIEDRNYQLFAVLAGVRNGTGFAGVVTGEPVEPISEPRGLPSDCELPDSNRFNQRIYDEPDEPDLGDHSQSWILLREILDYPWDESTVKIGVISLEQFRKWDRKSQPDQWSGGVSGPDVVTISEEQAHEGLIPRDKEVFVRIAWRQSLRNQCRRFLEGTVPWLQSLGSPDDVRLVFGFDS